MSKIVGRVYVGPDLETTVRGLLDSQETAHNDTQRKIREVLQISKEHTPRAKYQTVLEHPWRNLVAYYRRKWGI